MRSVRLIVWPQEVSEAIKVKMKKILDKNFKITNFWPTMASVLYAIGSKQSPFRPGPLAPFPGPPGPPHFYAGPTTVRQRPSFYVQSVPSEKVLPFIHLEICSFFFDTMYTTTSTLVCISLIKVGYGILRKFK